VQKKINRPLFVPPEGLDMKSLGALWDQLATQEVRYEKAARDSMVHFQRLDFTLKKVQSWLGREGSARACGIWRGRRRAMVDDYIPWCGIQ
jgi:hypothetical protein